MLYSKQIIRVKNDEIICQLTLTMAYFYWYAPSGHQLKYCINTEFQATLNMIRIKDVGETSLAKFIPFITTIILSRYLNDQCPHQLRI